MSKTTANLGLPYPEGTDVPDLGYWIKLLDDRIEAAFPTYSDTNVANAVPQAGWSVSTCQIHVRRGTVQVYLTVTRTGAAIAGVASGNIGNVNVCQLPSSILPLSPVGSGAGAAGQVVAAFMWTDGMVGIGATVPNVAINTNDSFNLCFVYPLAVAA